MFVTKVGLIWLIFSQLFKCLTVRRTLNSSSTTACSDIVVVCHFSAVIYFFSVDNDILLHWKSAINPFIEDLKQLLSCCKLGQDKTWAFQVKQCWCNVLQLSVHSLAGLWLDCALCSVFVCVCWRLAQTVGNTFLRLNLSPALFSQGAHFTSLGVVWMWVYKTRT